MFLKEYSRPTENNSVPYGSNPLSMNDNKKKLTSNWEVEVFQNDDFGIASNITTVQVNA